MKAPFDNYTTFGWEVSGDGGDEDEENDGLTVGGMPLPLLWDLTHGDWLGEGGADDADDRHHCEVL